MGHTRTHTQTHNLGAIGLSLPHVSGSRWDFLSAYEQLTNTHTHAKVRKHLHVEAHMTTQGGRGRGFRSHVQGATRWGATLISVPGKIGWVPLGELYGL